MVMQPPLQKDANLKEQYENSKHELCGIIYKGVNKFEKDTGTTIYSINSDFSHKALSITIKSDIDMTEVEKWNL